MCGKDCKTLSLLATPSRGPLLCSQSLAQAFTGFRKQALRTSATVAFITPPYGGTSFPPYVWIAPEPQGCSKGYIQSWCWPSPFGVPHAMPFLPTNAASWTNPHRHSSMQRLIESLQEITSHLTSTLPCRFLLRQSHKTYFSCRVVGLGLGSSIPHWSRKGTKRVARSSFRPETRCPSDRRASFSSSTVNSNKTSLHTRSRSSSPVWPRIASAIAPGAM